MRKRDLARRFSFSSFLAFASWFTPCTGVTGYDDTIASGRILSLCIGSTKSWSVNVYSWGKQFVLESGLRCWWKKEDRFTAIFLYSSFFLFLFYCRDRHQERSQACVDILPRGNETVHALPTCGPRLQ